MWPSQQTRNLLQAAPQSSRRPTSSSRFLVRPWAPLSFLALADAYWENQRSGTLPNASHLWHQSEISLTVNFTVWGMKQLAKLTFKPSALAMIKHLGDEQWFTALQVIVLGSSQAPVHRCIRCVFTRVRFSLNL